MNKYLILNFSHIYSIFEKCMYVYLECAGILRFALSLFIFRFAGWLKWRYMANVLPNNQVPHIGDYVRIICAISNKFEPPLSQGNQEDDETLGCRMLYLSKQVNSLKTYIEENGLDKRKVVWKPVDECDNFPLLDEEDLVNITCGVYQLKLASNYIQEHIDNDSEISI